ncbi:MAG: inositol-3-phosphate synthase [Candidatus Hodarchaeota archaeon]
MGRHKIRIALVGVGNCASSLLQVTHFYHSVPPTKAYGLMHYKIGGFTPADIEVVAAFDIDARKVGKDLSQAILADPNCTYEICREIPPLGVKVQMGRLLDGVAPHMAQYPKPSRFVVSKRKAVDVVDVLRKSGAEILINYLPVGAQRATEYYARSAVNAGVALVNCIPIFIASNEKWERRFRNKGLPIVGDDIKAQFGATPLHRCLVKAMSDRGIHIERTYQLNIGGNTDFLNMLDRSRLRSKKVSKTEAVCSEMPSKPKLKKQNIHVGPSDYVPWLKDKKICYIAIEGRQIAGIPITVEAKLSVEDSPNSAGTVVEAIRCCKLALQRGIGGALTSACAYLMKHPPKQMTEFEARKRLEAFIRGKDRN